MPPPGLLRVLPLDFKDALSSAARRLRPRRAAWPLLPWEAPGVEPILRRAGSREPLWLPGEFEATTVTGRCRRICRATSWFPAARSHGRRAIPHGHR